MYKPLNKGIKSARTGKNTVALVGFAKTTRDLTPWDDPDTEIWGLNEAYHLDYMKRWDRWFQLHPEDNFNRDNNPNHKEHPQWLRERHGKPIYLQKKFKYIPDAVKFPLNEVIEKFGDYLTSSFSFMIVLAMLEGFERIEVYGFEMGTHTEYHYQKAGAEYLIGMARGMGIEVYLPPTCTLCTGKMYGYKTMEVPFRQQLEYRMNGIEEQIPALRDAGMYEKGRLHKVAELLEKLPDNPIITEDFDAQSETTRLAVGKFNFILGGKHELGEVTQMFDRYLSENGTIGRQDFTSHEEENNKKEEENATE